MVHEIYMTNVRSSFKNAFLPKVNVSDRIKLLNIPKDYDFDKLDGNIKDIMREFVEDKMRETAFSFNQRDDPVGLKRALGEDSSVLDTEERFIEPKIKTAVTIEAVRNISIDEIKDKLHELREAPPQFAVQESVRQFVDDDVIHRVDPQDNLSEYVMSSSENHTNTRLQDLISSSFEKSPTHSET